MPGSAFRVHLHESRDPLKPHKKPGCPKGWMRPADRSLPRPDLNQCFATLKIKAVPNMSNSQEMQAHQISTKKFSSCSHDLQSQKSLKVVWGQVVPRDCSQCSLNRSSAKKQVWVQGLGHFCRLEKSGPPPAKFPEISAPLKSNPGF